MASNSLSSFYSYLYQMRKERSDIQKKLPAIIAEIESLLGKINQIESAIESSTAGTHVGASQSIEAAQSAKDRCNHAISLLNSMMSIKEGNACIKPASRSLKQTSGTSSSVILAGSEIQTHANQLREFVQILSDDKTYLHLLYKQTTMSNSSKDLTLSAEKYTSFTNNLDQISAGIQSYADLLTWANSKYYDAQKKAIVRAMSIPK